MLDDILKADALTVEFQPIFDLVHRRVYGYEALGRFTGELPGLPGAVRPGPAAMLDLASREGRLLALDRRWREIAVQSVALAAGDPRHCFFLNLDTRGLEEADHDSDFTARLVRRWGLSPRRFVIELTERDVALQSGALIDLTRRLKSRGFRIALDDVGAGYASLIAIVNVRPDIIKLDRELLCGVARDPLRRGLVQALVDFCRRSGVQTVAEGIEIAADLETLVSSGITLGQGYLLGYPRPLPPRGREATMSLPRASLSPPHLALPAPPALLVGVRRPEVIYEA